jgi:hypothetical protein
MRSSFERIRLLLKIGSRPRSRLQQISMRLDRSSLALSVPWKVPPLDPFCSAAGYCRRYRRFGHAGDCPSASESRLVYGNRVNPRNKDSLPIAWFLTKWVKQLNDFPNVDSRTLARARRDFERMVHLHRRGISSPDARWGWKNPRSLWPVPFLVDRFQELKFVHMIRDTRDMMLSENIYFLRPNGH